MQAVVGDVTWKGTTFQIEGHGKYALVDVLHRNIWLTVYNETTAHVLKKIFVSKLTLVIYDLSSFQLYTEQLIDNSVCLDWQITLGVNFLDEDQMLTPTHTNQYNHQLINLAADTNLSKVRQQELQYQLILCNNILSRARGLSLEFKEDIANIFLTEIDNKVINDKLYELANRWMSKQFPAASDLLFYLNQFYE